MAKLGDTVIYTSVDGAGPYPAMVSGTITGTDGQAYDTLHVFWPDGGMLFVEAAPKARGAGVSSGTYTEAV